MVLIAFFVLLSQQMLAGVRNQIADAREAKDKKEKLLKSFEQDGLDIDALEEWQQGSIPWIDEVYDVTARFPFDPPGFHLTRMDGNIVPRRNPKEKERYQARIALFCIDPAPGQREKFQDGLVSEHIQVQPVRVDGNKFTINLEMSYQQAKNYLVQSVLPPEMLTRITESLKQKK